jgi:hypothetical protein
MTVNDGAVTTIEWGSTDQLSAETYTSTASCEKVGVTYWRQDNSNDCTLTAGSPNKCGGTSSRHSSTYTVAGDKITGFGTSGTVTRGYEGQVIQITWANGNVYTSYGSCEELSGTYTRNQGDECTLTAGSPNKCGGTSSKHSSTYTVTGDKITGFGTSGTLDRWRGQVVQINWANGNTYTRGCATPVGTYTRSTQSDKIVMTTTSECAGQTNEVDQYDYTLIGTKISITGQDLTGKMTIADGGKVTKIEWSNNNVYTLEE